MHIVAIVGSDAGISAALRAREIDPRAEVTVVVADAYPNSSICGRLAQSIPATLLRRSISTVSRQLPWWRPTRRRTPTARNPARSCSRRLAVFSGNTLDWIVQIPPCSATSDTERAGQP